MLGGYGSVTGDQLINPQNYNELLAYAINGNTFIHKFDLMLPSEDLVFGSSMVIDPISNNYYVTSHSLFEEDNFLQLIKGNLDQPTTELMANEIPYTNLRNYSYTDLFYFPTRKHLITLIGYYDKSGSTKIELHQIRFPPNIAVVDVDIGPSDDVDITSYLIGLFLIIATINVLYFIFRNKKRRFHKEDTLTSASENDNSSEIAEDYIFTEPKNKSICFFGGFQVVSREGNHITSDFTPLLKELYLLILLHTLKDDKGISSEKLTEILWFDKSQESARNNKAVNIAKLKAILGNIGNCEVTHKTGYWKIVTNDLEIYCDYAECIKITDAIKSPGKKDILKLIAITKKGPMLGNVSYEWLDAFKATSSDHIVNTLIKYSDGLSIKDNVHLIIQIADCIYNCDIINEDAMFMKCKAHYILGSYSLSKDTYDNFTREYKSLYAEDYDIDFSDIINKPRNEIVQ